MIKPEPRPEKPDIDEASLDLEAWIKWLQPQTAEKLGDALCRNAEQGNLAQVRWLLAQDETNVNARDAYALRHSITNGHTEIALLLLDHGSKIDSFDHHAFFMALRHDNVPVVEKLVEKGQDVQVKGDHALNLAARTGSIPMLNLLFDHGADVFGEACYAWQEAYEYGQKEAADLIGKKIGKAEALREKKQVKHRYFKHKTMQQLRNEFNEHGENGIVIAAKSDKFSRIMKKAIEQRRGRLLVSDLLTKDREGNNVIEILGYHNRLKSVFNAKVWAGRMPALQKIWSEHVPEHLKSQIDIDKVADEVHLLSNRQKIRQRHYRKALKLGRRVKKNLR